MIENMESVLESARIPTRVFAHWLQCQFHTSYPSMLREALSARQLASKIWLIEKLDEYVSGGAAAVFGGWCGLSCSLLHHLSAHEWTNIFSIDKNRKCREVARVLCSDIPGFEAIVAEIEVPTSLDFQVAINTIAEHLDPIQMNAWLETLPKNTIYAVQSTNIQMLSHICPSHDLEHLVARLSKTRILFSGSLELQEKGTFRHMVIGSMNPN